MEVGRQKHMQDDQTSNCWSYGSIIHPASQSRKMSIGVVVDSIAKKKSGSAKEREVVVPNAETENANLANTIEGKFNGEEVTAAKTTKETKTPEQKKMMGKNNKERDTKDRDADIQEAKKKKKAVDEEAKKKKEKTVDEAAKKKKKTVDEEGDDELLAKLCKQQNMKKTLKKDEVLM
ncbi:PREDICTED: uncharacterized protein LOC101291044 [Fragaria vesca subsp. vesca]